MKLKNALGCLLAGMVAGPALAAPVTLTFDQTALLPSNPIGNFYAGGVVGGVTGPSYGASFSNFALAVVSTTSPNSTPANGAGILVLYDATPGNLSTTTTLSVTPGFNGPLDFSWSARSKFTVDLYGVSGLVSTTIFTPTIPANEPFSAWATASLSTGGSLVTQVKFTGTSNDVALDNISFDLQGPTGGTVPEPGSMALAGLGLMAAWGASRRRRMG